MEKELEKRELTIKKFLFGWVEDNWDKAFLALLAIAFLLRLWIFFKTMNQPLWWDIASYLATAKKWAWSLNVNGVWYFRRGLFWPLFSALFFKLGLGEKGIRFATCLFSTGIVAVSYFLIKKIFNKKLAFFACIGLTFSWVSLFFTGRPMTSIPSAFFLLTAVLCFYKGYVLKEGNKFLYLFSLFYALAILTRMQSLMFAPVFIIYFFIHEKFGFLKNKQLWIALGIFALIMVPQAVVYNSHFGNPVADILTYYLGIGGLSTSGESGGTRTLSTVLDYFYDLPYALTKPIFFLFLLGAILFFWELVIGADRIFKNKEIQKKALIFFLIVIPILILGYITGLVEQRYLMAVYPFLFLVAAIPFISLEGYFKKHLNFRKNTAIILVVLMFTLVFVYPSIGFLQNNKSNLSWGIGLIELKKDSYGEVMDAGIWMKENSNPDDIIISESYPQTAYYSERSTFSFDSKGNPEERVPQNRTEFEEFVAVNKPKYIMVSVFQNHPDWVHEYVQQNQDKLKPTQAYMQGEQPVLIIYEVQYSEISQSSSHLEN